MLKELKSLPFEPTLGGCTVFNCATYEMAVAVVYIVTVHVLTPDLAW